MLTQEARERTGQQLYLNVERCSAIRTAANTPNVDQQMRQLLALSLDCYCSEEDLILTRKDFIATVASRIQDDLEHDTE